MQTGPGAEVHGNWPSAPSSLALFASVKSGGLADFPQKQTMETKK
jgi:hypothetical protein